MDNLDRLNAEWITLSAFRGLMKIATKGDMNKSKYDNVLAFCGDLYPELLGNDVSLLKAERESQTTREYRQKARLKSKKEGRKIDTLELVKTDLDEFESLFRIAKREKEEQKKVDQLKRRLNQLTIAYDELSFQEHSENQILNRDVYKVHRPLPSLIDGIDYKDFWLPDKNTLRLRILHPEKTEHITGADLIYEKHSSNDEASIIAIQYKIWENKKLYLNDTRMNEQIDKLKTFFCKKSICDSYNSQMQYRFPCCSAFIRPTDKLQSADQKLMSTGEHLPICKIDECTSTGKRGARLLEYDNIKDISLSNESFEFLFNTGKIGSRNLTYDELTQLYSNFLQES
ncbi:hypothetical protein FGH87_24685, partial [Salmonella enterica]|nr:hypothetical protein [Salmonella enterica subsp. enterica serovar Lattenkamp]EAR5597491.1 hypothetical protein [Salmonella enterica]EDS3899319.1 hypothetical protein [Salmonella enterica subsp. enterica]EAV2737211.1 hypothetical protein [Salmonella enterica]EAW5735653.1 hypothetical protein [Salmonella enterica]